MPGSGSGDVPSAQGSTISFGGTPLGSLIAIRVTGESANTTDITSLESVLSGSGSSNFMFRQMDCLAVDPGTVSVTFWGTIQGVEVGDRGELSVTIAGSTVISGDAFLASFEVEASVGALVQGSAVFQLTGE